MKLGPPKPRRPASIRPSTAKRWCTSSWTAADVGGRRLCMLCRRRASMRSRDQLERLHKCCAHYLEACITVSTSRKYITLYTLSFRLSTGTWYHNGGSDELLALKRFWRQACHYAARCGMARLAFWIPTTRNAMKDTVVTRCLREPLSRRRRMFFTLMTSLHAFDYLSELFLPIAKAQHNWHHK